MKLYMLKKVFLYVKLGMVDINIIIQRPLLKMNLIQLL